MSRSYLLYLVDIIESIEKIKKYTSGLDFDSFSENQLVIDAVIRNFEIIGEASNYVPLEVQDRYLEIPWRLMKAMRNIMIHEYFGVDLEIVWQTVSFSLPELLEVVRKVHNEEEQRGIEHD